LEESRARAHCLYPSLASLSNELCIHSKQPSVHSKVPHIHPQKTCAQLKEPCVHSNEPYLAFAYYILLVSRTHVHSCTPAFQLCTHTHTPVFHCSTLRQAVNHATTQCYIVCLPRLRAEYVCIYDRSVLQCVAVCCSVVQCGAVWCSVVQCGAVCCSVQHTLLCASQHQSTVCMYLQSQCGAVFFSLQRTIHTTRICSVLQYVAVLHRVPPETQSTGCMYLRSQLGAMCCSVLQCATSNTRHKILQCVTVPETYCAVVCCSVLQRVAVPETQSTHTALSVMGGACCMLHTDIHCSTLQYTASMKDTQCTSPKAESTSMVKMRCSVQCVAVCSAL